MRTAYLPVTVRGDRCGVLVVTLPAGAASPDNVRDLAAISEMLGHALRVADRDTDVYRQARRARALTPPAEMQWELLPGRICRRAAPSGRPPASPSDALVGRAVEAAGGLTCASAPGAVYREIVTSGAGMSGGGAVLCLDWRGRPGAPVG
ncbi:hypothetical protein [Streptomyces sp. NPDC059176]